MGAKTGLRDCRNERFAGKSAYAQSTDLRWNFNYLKTGLLPIHIGFLEHLIMAEFGLEMV